MNQVCARCGSDDVTVTLGTQHVCAACRAAAMAIEHSGFGFTTVLQETLALSRRCLGIVPAVLGLVLAGQLAYVLAALIADEFLEAWAVRVLSDGLLSSIPTLPMAYVTAAAGQQLLGRPA